MNIGERPSDENVRSAIEELMELTRCRCNQEIGDAYGHADDCWGDYRADVVVLVAAAGQSPGGASLGWTAPGAGCATQRRRYP